MMGHHCLLGLPMHISSSPDKEPQLENHLTKGDPNQCIDHCLLGLPMHIS